MPSVNAPFEADLSLGDGVRVERVHAVRGLEELSQPFRYEVDFSASDLDPEKLRGAAAHLLLKDSLGQERHIRGYLHRFVVQAVLEGSFRVLAVLVPVPLLLALRHGFRVFQDKTAPDIIRAVFHGAGMVDSDFAWALEGKYPKRPLCIQYDESEWDFINRLAEHEGIAYGFEHVEGGPRMRFFDKSESVAKAEPEVVYFHPDGLRHPQEVRAWGVSAAERVSASRVTVRDHDFLHPSSSPPGSVNAKAPASGVREWYAYPAGFTTGDEGKELARRRLELFQAERASVTLSTNALGVLPGKQLKLENQGAHDGDYLVTRVDFALRLDGSLSTDGPGRSPGCVLELELLPLHVPYRPPLRAARPRIAGLQTARVTGPAGEEIHCDSHGRVKLQFHWDRQGKLDDKSSAWIRVAQSHTTGSVMIPRVGWEVLVEFLHGDPDRPICLGRVYNPTAPPPHALPAQKTVSGHQSHSSPGGAGTNALVFDDAAGSERLHLHAERDLNIEVANNKNYHVAKADSRSVKVNRDSKIGGKEDISVVGDLSLAVQGKETLTVGAVRKVQVDGGVSQGTRGAMHHSVSGARMVQVGSPGAAVLQLLEASAMAAAQGLAASAASQAQPAVMAPLAPALAAAKASLGPAASLLPAPAQALLSGDPSAVCAALQQAHASPPTGSGAPVASHPEVPSSDHQAASSLAAGAAQAVASGGGAGGGGGGAGGGAAGGAPGAVGNGTWGVTVGGDVKETIGGLCAVQSLGPLELGVGGASSETVGALRAEVVRGAKSETTEGSKVETVGGLYLLDLATSLSMDAKLGLAQTVAGNLKQKIGKGHDLSSELAALVTASRVKLTGSETITFKCGQAELVLSSEGIAIKGTDITIRGTQSLKLDPPAIAPG